MRNLKYYYDFAFASTCSMLLLLGLSMPMLALAQGEKKEALIGHWTFEPGEELKDLTKHFGDLKLINGATVEKGQLKIGVNEWAITTGYKGLDIKEKTLVAWLYLDDLDVRRGAPLGINKSSADQFDAIVYAERQVRRWMAGSSFFKRTQDATPGFEEKETGKLIHLAISYEDAKGNAHIKLYRNGDLIGDYTQGPIETWVKGDTEAIFGPRAVIAGTAHGWVVARVEEARIYGAVLSQAEVKALTLGVVTSVNPSGKLATLWGAMKAK